MRKISVFIAMFASIFAFAEYYNGLEYQEFFFRQKSDSTATVVGVDPNWSSTDIVILDSVLLPHKDGMKMFPVKHVSSRAISSNNNITSLKFNNIGIRLEDYAIQKCKSLRKIEIPYNCSWASATGSSDYMFYQCTGLDTIIIDCNVIDGCFSECDTINYIYFGPNVTDIRLNHAFRRTYAKHIEWNVKNGNAAFNFPDAETFIFGDSVQTIPNSICSGMKNLKSIQLPKVLKEIPDYAFKNTGLEQLSIPDSVIRIGKSAFYETKISELTIGEGIDAIGNLAFAYCPNLKTIHYNAIYSTFENDWNNYTKSIFKGSKIDTIYIGYDVSVIPQYTFYGVKTVKNITSYAEVAPSLGYSAFYEFEPVSEVMIPCKLSEDSYIEAWWRNPNFSPLKNSSVFSYMHELIIKQSSHGNICAEQLTCDNYILTATPDENYYFIEWSDGIKENPRVYNYTGHKEITAIFSNESTSVKNITIENDLSPKYNILGQKVGDSYHGIIISPKNKKLRVQD